MYLSSSTCHGLTQTSFADCISLLRLGFRGTHVATTLLPAALAFQGGTQVAHFFPLYFFLDFIHILLNSIHPCCHAGLGPTSLSGVSCSWAARGGGGLGENQTQDWKSKVTQ
jgi:hypothetical protein